MDKAYERQKGMATLLVLIALGVGSLTLIPFLDFARSSTGATGPGRAAKELYATDAGIFHAVWNVTKGDFATTVLASPGDTMSYSLSESVNGLLPTVTITRDKLVLASDDFETDSWTGGNGWLGDWYESGDATVLAGGIPYEGSYHLRLRENTGYVKRELDLSNRSGARLQFSAKAESYESGDEAYSLISSDGNSWTSIQSWVDGDDDNTYRSYDIDLSPYALLSRLWIAFQANMSGDDDRLYIDDLRVVRILPGAELNLPEDDFESDDLSGGQGWTSDWTFSGDAEVRSQDSPQQGNYHLRMRNASSRIERSANLSGKSGLHLQLWAKVDSLEGGDSVQALVSPNYVDWTVVKTWGSGDSDDTYHFVDIDLSAYGMTSDFWLAFDSDMNSSNDRFFIDDLRFAGTIAFDVVVTAGSESRRAIINVDNGNVAILNWQEQ